MMFVSAPCGARDSGSSAQLGETPRGARRASHQLAPLFHEREPTIELLRTRQERRVEMQLMGADALAPVNEADPETIHAICEEYRAAATLDFEQDEADQREGRRIGCPVLALWSGHGALQWYDTLEIWRGWADKVQGRPLDCGHFLPEEAPDETYSALRAFLMGRDEAAT